LFINPDPESGMDAYLRDFTEFNESIE